MQVDHGTLKILFTKYWTINTLYYLSLAQVVFCFDLSTGRQLDPLGREQHIQSYPVRVDSDTGTISIGFASFVVLLTMTSNVVILHK